MARKTKPVGYYTGPDVGRCVMTLTFTDAEGFRRTIEFEADHVSQRRSRQGRGGE